MPCWGCTERKKKKWWPECYRKFGTFFAQPQGGGGGGRGSYTEFSWWIDFFVGSVMHAQAQYWHKTQNFALFKKETVSTQSKQQLDVFLLHCVFSGNVLNINKKNDSFITSKWKRKWFFCRIKSASIKITPFIADTFMVCVCSNRQLRLIYAL